ncbi:hypothetical protein CLHUN_40760 [Ruminiclostridium hungatei]|uniref:DUF3696 domain-containing protein n=1 Tax=Ruminiclostridium hungatei TaxID=48256 RepID=A0A1V4SFM7_RUMHU|nr:DUF3696 domain-containing protein [Ruminiclostridium hungatei]OPX42077.1 hypothetical protein CLHUN_40760 [Ruminiclostridium hungatei]
MFKLLEIENFKCFSGRTPISLSQLTVCTGMNSVGKSTLIQALLLIKQSHESLGEFKDRNVLLNTEALRLGSTNQIMLTDKMILSVDGDFIEYSAGEDKLSLIIDKISSSGDLFDMLDEDIDTDIELDTMQDIALYYLNAERLGPRNYQEMKSHNFLHCGYHGEYTFDVVEKNPDTEVPKKRRYNLDSNQKVPHLIKQIDYWMSYIVNGVEVNFSSDVTSQLSQMKVRQAALDTPFNSPYNFGFGISYVLPIIVTGLMANANSVIIVENPEAHLHPAGQSRIGEFLAQISCDDVQVVIETHSEHVINGIRRYALKNNLLPDDICINYFSINKETHKHEVSRLLLNDRMDILKWPDGFFDQEAKDLKELRELRGGKK